MHIALDARLVYYRRYSGIGQYIVQLAEELPALKPDWQFTLIHSRKDRSMASPLARLMPAWTPSHHRFEQIVFPIELRRLKIDLLHSPDFIPPFRGDFKRIITVHDLNFLYYPQFLTADSRRYYNDQIERAVTLADHILADSHATKNDLIKVLNVPAEKISVVWLAPNSIFRPIDRAALNEPRSRLQLPDRFILFTGTFEPRKNIAGLLIAYRSLLDRTHESIDLVLAGSRGWLFNETYALIHQLHLTDRVRLIEAPSESDLVGLYNCATVFVLPSYYEGFGLTVLEAMACGAPCIISNRGSLPEVAGHAALIVDPDDEAQLTDALERVLSDPQLRSNLKQQGFERVEEFSWQRCMRETLAVYLRTLKAE
ncbi:MAG TPA: glycosyltransferase family 1 protein [Anaerolineae bacterium]|nr:glycosyltransferase family 1 protein [Anaerolineae bacterium]